MKIDQQINLKDFSTMRLGGLAKYLCFGDSLEDITKLIDWAKGKQEKFIVIGRGSNIIWGDNGYDGLVIVDRTKGRKIISESVTNAVIQISSGEEWDEIVGWTVQQGLSGFEFLSLIPGTVGATPVQNIGAYGAEIADTLLSISAYDSINKEFIEISKEDCDFGYRTSRFKTTDKGRYVITSITVELTKTSPTPPFYDALQKYLDEKGIYEYSPQVIRDAVINIRNSKLPDPKYVANNGSFFTNPIIEKSQFENLKSQYPEIKGWPYRDKIKVAAGWLVEAAGFKDYHDKETGMATYNQQSLVLINEHASSTADLLKFKQKIVDKVESMFGITLEQEPELIS